jgi:Tat protein secretion system quality control protein TatD with DNase activity
VGPISSKEEHYRALFLDPKMSSEEHVTILNELLPHLPDPLPLTEVLQSLRQDLLSHSVSLLGEVGLDRSFRVSFDYHANPRRLTPFTIPIAHQLEILEAQLALAVELRRCISMHSVKSHAVTIELLNKMERKWGPKWRAINVDIHSCGLSAETWGEITVGFPVSLFTG